MNVPPARQVRVLVVDDSVVMRRVVARALERDASIAQTDFAANGAVALTKIALRRPDVVILDLEMPVLDGVRTLQELHRTHRDLPVVLFSGVDENRARAALEAASVGPVELLSKPSTSSVAAAEEFVVQHLTPLVLALGQPRRATSPVRTFAAGGPSGPVEVAVLAASTGGPEALSVLVGRLPVDLPVPLLIVQHMPATFTRLLAERLDRLGGLAVHEAVHGEPVLPATAYVAPGGRHLSVAAPSGEVRVVLGDGPPENSCRPAADVLFRSAAQVYGGRTLAVVLTGMGRDGLRGCESVRAAGGQVVVQDPATALLPSMPGSVVDAGLAHAALPLELLAADVVQRLSAEVVR